MPTALLQCALLCRGCLNCCHVRCFCNVGKAIDLLPVWSPGGRHFPHPASASWWRVARKHQRVRADAVRALSAAHRGPVAAAAAAEDKWVAQTLDAYAEANSSAPHSSYAPSGTRTLTRALCCAFAVSLFHIQQKCVS